MMEAQRVYPLLQPPRTAWPAWLAMASATGKWLDMVTTAIIMTSAERSAATRHPKSCLRRLFDQPSRSLPSPLC